MHLFRASLSNDQPDGVLTHFGTLAASVHHVHTLFLQQMHMAYNGRHFLKVDHNKQPVEVVTPMQVLQAFSDFAQRTAPARYEVNVGRTLRLNDCWDDDPIGSGGTDIFAGNEDFTPAEREQAERIFYPFKGIIQPLDVFDHYSPQQLTSIFERNKRNPVFLGEFAKRELRAIALKEDFQKAGWYEVVWVDRTLQLREWAMGRRYNSFVYTNKHEDWEIGEDSYVTLRDNQIARGRNSMVFDAQRYMDEVAPVFEDFTARVWSVSRDRYEHEVKDVLWAGHNPLNFWREP